MAVYPRLGKSDGCLLGVCGINVAAARTYAVNVGAPLAFVSVGNVRFLDNEGLDIKAVKASVSFDEGPLVYTNFNTTGLAGTVPYNTEGEQSWEILQQLNEGFPSYIPNAMGSYVKRTIVSIATLFARAD